MGKRLKLLLGYRVEIFEVDVHKVKDVYISQTTESNG